MSIKQNTGIKKYNKKAPGLGNYFNVKGLLTLSCLCLILGLYCVDLAAQGPSRLKPGNTQGGPSLSVTALQAEGRSGSAGIYLDEARPILSWQVKAPQLNDVQISSWQVKVASNKASLIKSLQNEKEVADLQWDSGKKKLDLQNSPGGLRAGFQTRYAGKELLSDRTYYWSVKVSSVRGRQSSWSDVDSFQIGLLKKEDWKGAHWIARKKMASIDRVLPGDKAKTKKGPDGKEIKLPFGANYDTLPLFRKTFNLKGPKEAIQKATLYISGLGHFEPRLNGKKIGDQLLAPGWTNYQKAAFYVGLDVKELLQSGENVLGVLLGGGFYFVPAAKGWYRKLLVQYGYPKLICRLSIQYSTGETENIISDGSWQTAKSSIVFNSIYGGQLEDARLSKMGWDSAGYKVDADWRPVIQLKDTPAKLRAQLIDPTRVMARFNVANIYKVAPGLKNPDSHKSTFTYDMGQNASAIPYIRIKGKKGDTVILRPAELMNKDHRVNQKATGKYKLIYVLGRDGAQSWRPRFSYTGFRYIQVEGAVPKDSANPANEPTILEIESWHIRNSAPPAGHFSSSNPLFNKTSDLINWAIKSNMMSVLTDCPTREKLGWLEQVHLMGSSLRYNWQVALLMKKALADMRESQTPTGLVPEIAPEYTVFTWGGDIFRDSPEWGSSCVIIPWYLYEWYGDTTELVKSYDMMKRYVQYLDSQAKDHIVYKGLGDWYDLGPKAPGVSQLTPMGLTATAMYYYDLQILEKTAKLLGKNKDASKYNQASKIIRKAFNDKFLKVENGGHVVYYGTGSQTADAMAIYMKLVPENLAQNVLDHLVQGLKHNDYRLTAGDVGYRYVLRVLEEGGYNEVIFKMNNRTDVPGYGYQLTHGATSLTESWDALPSSSQNHFMLGHLMEWFYSGVLGIRLNLAQDSGTLKQWPAPLIIQPTIVGDLSSAKGCYESIFGPIKSEWQKNQAANDLSLHLDVSVPVGLTAVIRLPRSLNGKSIDLESFKQAFGTKFSVKLIQKLEQSLIEIPIGSGQRSINIHYR